jgi:hypothetical protein
MKEELTKMMAMLETKNYSDVQSIDALLEYGFELAQYIARSGQLMSEAKEMLHRARRAAYKEAEGILKAKDRKYSPLLLKDYINDCCAEQNALYELADRTNKACTHAHSLVITAVSALKAEMFSSKFSNAA